MPVTQGFLAANLKDAEYLCHHLCHAMDTDHTLCPFLYAVGVSLWARSSVCSHFAFIHSLFLKVISVYAEQRIVHVLV